MITKITGRLVRLGEMEATLQIGAFEYQVLIPGFVRRQLQSRNDKEISLHTIEYLDGNVQKGGRMTPRLVGFLSEAEREFFELFCSVDGVGVRKALNAMNRPVRDVATAIEEQDAKLLATLPGIGPAGADRVIAKLRRKMAKFALIVARQESAAEAPQADLFAETYEALVSLGHSPADARRKLEAVAPHARSAKTIQDLLNAIYQQQQR